MLFINWDKWWSSPVYGSPRLWPDYILGNFYRELKHAPLGLTLSGPWLLTPGFELGWVFPQHQALTGRLPHWGSSDVVSDYKLSPRLHIPKLLGVSNWVSNLSTVQKESLELLC
ncbi:hypothetical protein OSB04_017947 [Centaurea solstitialis]|uniref:Uncharacterized protein n=1 Tax=Centaurea solstitialis TaxID=347529 RepID=A0AA38TLX6_9ASTR|nr:hypothetical protein OSB04_017947 [Centaurea solstitialis]